MHGPALQGKAVNACQAFLSEIDSLPESAKAVVLFRQPQSLLSPKVSSQNDAEWENLFILASTAAEVERAESTGHHVQDLRQVTPKLSRKYKCRLAGSQRHKFKRPHYSSGLDPPISNLIPNTHSNSSPRKTSMKPTKCTKSRAHFGEVSRLRQVQKDIIQLFAIEAKLLQERVIRGLLGDSPDTSKALRRLCSLQILKRYNCGGRKAPFEYKLEETPAALIKLQERTNATHEKDIYSKALQILGNNKPNLCHQPGEAEPWTMNFF